MLTCPKCGSAFSEAKVTAFDFECPTCNVKLKSNAGPLMVGNLLVLGILTLPFDLSALYYVVASVIVGVVLYFVAYKPFIRIQLRHSSNDEA